MNKIALNRTQLWSHDSLEKNRM